jgi:hypothetical protein
VIVRNLDPIVHMLKLLRTLGVISHMKLKISDVAIEKRNRLSAEDFTNPLIDVTIYE